MARARLHGSPGTATDSTTTGPSSPQATGRYANAPPWKAFTNQADVFHRTGTISRSPKAPRRECPGRQVANRPFDAAIGVLGGRRTSRTRDPG